MKKILFALVALLGIVACENTTIEPINDTIKLSVDNTEIYANGSQVASFSVVNDKGEVINDAIIYFADTNEALDGNTFKTKYAGEYTFYAKHGNSKSNTVKVVAKEVVEDTKVVTLSYEPSDDITVGESVTFTVDCNGTDVTSESVIYSTVDNAPIEGNSFVAQVAGEFSFYAMYDDVKSNNVTVRFVKNEEPPVVSLALNVSPATIVADGVSKAVFTLNADGEVVADFEVYNAANNTKLAANEFSTTAAGNYSFYAMYEGEKSNTVEVIATEFIAEQKPITLTASKTTIKANGVDVAQLTVTEEGGADVTNASTIFVNGGVLNGNKFATTTHGTYTIYATKGEMKSNEITITAEEVTATGTTTVFAEGVTLTSGWYDVNKKSTPNSSGADAMMCWAASSSNIIQWFQDRYVADGNTLPAGCPNGTSSKYDYELQIMDVFRDNWDNLARGNWTDGGVIWYFEGRDVYETNSKESCAHPRSGTGGYFKSQWSGIFDNMYKYENGWSWYTGEPYTYATEINNYNWRGSSVADPLMKFSEYIIAAFDHGMSSMAVAMSSNFNGAHAVTIWGYEMDNATGYVTKLYIADSDDGSTPMLQPYTVSAESGNAKIVLNGYTAYYPFALYPVSGYNSANN